MMKDECSLIRDILPLYTENMISDYTRNFINEHIKNCPECGKELAEMQRFSSSVSIPENDSDVLPLKHLQKKLFQKKLLTILCTAALMLALLTSAFAYLTAPEYFPYSDDLLTLTETADGAIIITFAETVPHILCTPGKDPDTGTTLYFIEAWRTVLDQNTDNSLHPETITFTPASGEKICIYYSPNGTSDVGDILLYDNSPSQITSGIATLPRLVLGYYFILALLCCIVSAIALFILRKKKQIRIWMERILFLSFSYLLGHLCVKGFTSVSYSAQRDFYLIVFVGLLIYCGLLCIISLIRRRKTTVE